MCAQEVFVISKHVLSIRFVKIILKTRGTERGFDVFFTENATAHKNKISANKA